MSDLNLYTVFSGEGSVRLYGPQPGFTARTARRRKTTLLATGATRVIDAGIRVNKYENMVFWTPNISSNSQKDGIASISEFDNWFSNNPAYFDLSLHITTAQYSNAIIHDFNGWDKGPGNIYTCTLEIEIQILD